MSNHHLHLINILFSSASKTEFKTGLTEFTVKPSFYADSMLISRHWEGLDSLAMSSKAQAQHQVSNDQLQVIRITLVK